MQEWERQRLLRWRTTTLLPDAVTCTYRATYLADVTIPDNTVIPPGTSFVKTWKLRNDGNCAWGPGTTVDSMLAVGGATMGNAGPVPLTFQVAPGQSANLSVTLTAPTAAGTHRSDWKLHRTNGALFGVGASSVPFYVQIKVNSASTAERITFASGATVWSKQGSLTFPNRKEFLLRALAGQVMTVAIVSPEEPGQLRDHGRQRRPAVQTVGERKSLLHIHAAQNAGLPDRGCGSERRCAVCAVDRGCAAAMNYCNTFIAVAPDTSIKVGTVPVEPRGEGIHRGAGV